MNEIERRNTLVTVKDARLVAEMNCLGLVQTLNTIYLFYLFETLNVQ